MSELFKNLFVEKYRPQNLSEIVLSDNNRKYFESITDEIPNLLFVGVPGLGKTTLAKILVNDVLQCQYLYINASDENGIDTIRSKVVNFSQTKSFDGKHKVVVLDECLDEDTLVHVLRDGVKCQIPIKDLDQNNDLVKSYNQVKDCIEYRPFKHFFMGEQDCFEIEFENDEKVICTGSHKWYVKDKNDDTVRMKLDDIISNDIKSILTEGDNIEIKKITKLDSKKKVYDLSVDHTHNFFVGKQGILTSNCDGMTIDSQRALRNTMEEYSSMTRFILTANYKHKIIPAIQSRTQYFDLTPPFDYVLKRVISIIKQEKIKINEDQKTELVNLIKQGYPDIRKVINNIQRSTIDNIFTVDLPLENKSIVNKIHQNITDKDVLTLRTYLIENENEFQGDYHALMKQYLNFVYESDLDDNKKRQYIVTISEHMYSDVFVLDKEINAFACWVNLEKI